VRRWSLVFLLVPFVFLFALSCGGGGGGGGGGGSNCTPIPNRFVVTENNGWNDTVYDTYTGLTWIKDQLIYDPTDWSAYLGYDVTSDGFRYADAQELITAANVAIVGGYNDWGLPSATELMAFNSNICDFPGPFVNYSLDEFDGYWTSTSDEVCGSGQCWREQYVVWWGRQDGYWGLRGAKNFVWLARP
jgi:hypothetical protein